MWTPASVDELERAARSGRLVEKKRFEAKREVGRNKDVAIDVNAMALDGGAVVYGIAEDANGRPRIPAPIELGGQRAADYGTCRPAVTHSRSNAA